jgi:hypothetical protein
MLLSHQQNASQNWDIETANRSFENVSQFKNLGMTVTNENMIMEEVNRGFNSGNTYCDSVQNFVFSSAVKSLEIIYTVLLFCLWFCMVVKLGL